MSPTKTDYIYDPTEKCPKCGGEMTPTFREATRDSERSEWIVVKCHTCEWSGVRAPLDQK